MSSTIGLRTDNNRNVRFPYWAIPVAVACLILVLIIVFFARKLYTRKQRRRAFVTVLQDTALDSCEGKNIFVISSISQSYINYQQCYCIYSRSRATLSLRKQMDFGLLLRSKGALHQNTAHRTMFCSHPSPPCWN